MKRIVLNSNGFKRDELVEILTGIEIKVGKPYKFVKNNFGISIISVEKSCENSYIKQLNGAGLF